MFVWSLKLLAHDDSSGVRPMARRAKPEMRWNMGLERFKWFSFFSRLWDHRTVIFRTVWLVL